MGGRSGKEESTPSSPPTTRINVPDDAASATRPYNVRSSTYMRKPCCCLVCYLDFSLRNSYGFLSGAGSSEESESEPGFVNSNSTLQLSQLSPLFSGMGGRLSKDGSTLPSQIYIPDNVSSSATPYNARSSTSTRKSCPCLFCCLVLSLRNSSTGSSNESGSKSSLLKSTSTTQNSRLFPSYKSPATRHACLFPSNDIPSTVTTIKSESGLANSIPTRRHTRHPPSNNVPATVPTTKSESGLINSTSTTRHSSNVPATVTTIKSEFSLSPPKPPSIVTANRVVVFDVNSYTIPRKEIDTSYPRTVNNPKFKRAKTDKNPLRVCFKFNGKRGCKFLNYCYRFHVCQSWINGFCRKDQCPLYHNFNNNENIQLFSQLSSKHFGEDELREHLQRNMYHNNGIKENLSEIICMDYLSNTCEIETCLSYHIKCTYSWEVKLNNEWLKFPRYQNEEIEKAFCDPTNDGVFLSTVTRTKNLEDNFIMNYLNSLKKKCKIRFHSMDIKSKKRVNSVRRLSTPSDVASFKSVATRWLWYYETEDNEWRFYDNAYVDKRLIIPFSDYIETMYLNKENDFIYSLSPNTASYRAINFETMMDSEIIDFGLVGCLESGLCRRIKRRPYPIDTNRRRGNTTFRSLWSKEENSTFRRKVEPTSPEFHFVKKLLITSISIRQIHIERIENRHMWNAYQLKKSLMMHNYRNNLSKVNEQYLFHGTSEKASEKIPTGNLGWRLYGTHVGNIYGKGAYFANSAQISDLYASEDDDGYKYILVAMVLIGTAAVGNEEMSYPPVNPSTKDRFDSTVDGVNPRIFVKYNLDEYYPAYMVKYCTWQAAPNNAKKTYKRGRKKEGEES